jgi:hypothetical protein
VKAPCVRTHGDEPPEHPERHGAERHVASAQEAPERSAPREPRQPDQRGQQHRHGPLGQEARRQRHEGKPRKPTSRATALALGFGEDEARDRRRDAGAQERVGHRHAGEPHARDVRRHHEPGGEARDPIAELAAEREDERAQRDTRDDAR